MNKPTVWAMFYANLCAMNLHPGVKAPLSLSHLAFIADQMMEHYEARTEKPKCQSSEQSSEPELHS